MTFDGYIQWRKWDIHVPIAMSAMSLCYTLFIFVLFMGEAWLGVVERG